MTNPTLSSPRYASHESLEFQMYKKQENRKRRNKTQTPTERFFRLNEGTTDYATIPEVTLSGDFVIGFDVLFSAFNGVIFGSSLIGNHFLRFNSATSATLNLPGVGSNFSLAALDLNVLYEARISRVGSVVTLEIGGQSVVGSSPVSGSLIFDLLYQKFGVNFLSGIMANLTITDNGTLARSYAIDDNSDTIKDSVGGFDGTVINGNNDDWGKFFRNDTGWIGFNLAVPPWDSTTQELVIA